jgi:hypothetical protein
MHRSVVRLVSGSLLLVTFGCSETQTPLMASARQSLASAAVTSLAYAPGVHVSAIPALDGANYSANGLNDWGEVVGQYTNPANVAPSSAFKWEGSRGLTLLPPDTAYPEYEYGAAGVNDSGLVALGIDSDSGGRAGTWGWFGQVKHLRMLSSFTNGMYIPSCQMAGINDHGVTVGTCNIVGYDGESPGGTVPTVWTAYGTPDALFPGGGTNPVQGYAYAISDAGYIAGYQQITNSGKLPVAYVFTPMKQFALLMPLPVDSIEPATEAFAVNDSGYAAGFSSDNSLTPCGSGFRRAAAWLRGLTPVDLGVCGQAVGLTDDNIVVGNAVDSTGIGATSTTHAFIWTAARGVLRLPGLEGGTALSQETSTVVAVNHVHQILGTIITSGGLQRTVVWTVPASY